MSAQVAFHHPLAHHGSRRPLSNANVNYAIPGLPKSHPPPTKPSSPPLPRQNTKAVPPSPPKVICDDRKATAYTRVGLLGEGGFARVYEVKDVQGVRQAVKVITKDSLKTKKAKTKLYAEIKIHKSLSHPNIVRFQDCFEDNANVYITLELCECGSLMDLLRRRRRFTEPEVRFFLVQILGACNYMHTHQVIHRDLKLGNLFLDASMNIKIGDFGLAALIENPGERKKTICGTPNYIAPEVLFDTANGHSFEVDTWSVGVILYTLLVGKPPFQTSEVKAIYKRIRDNEYSFPEDRRISDNAKSLIEGILTPDPQQRPTLLSILADAFVMQGVFPSFIPLSAHDSTPNFQHISRLTSQANFAQQRKLALLDEDQVTAISVPSVPIADQSTGSRRSHLAPSLAQQEREFQKAVQPGSPISALLSSARQPLVMASGGEPGSEGKLYRKLQSAAREKRSPAQERLRNMNVISEEDELDERDQAMRQKELESQKARIVAQMVPQAPVPPAKDGEKENRNVAPMTSVATTRSMSRKLKSSLPPVPVSPPEPKAAHNTFEVAAENLTKALDAKNQGKLFRDPVLDQDLPEAKVFIVSWVDYCNKYGMGYALTDGSVGVHFNDSTSLVLSADKNHFDFISTRRQGGAFVRKNYTISEYPEDLKNKVYLLKHFEKYIMEKLYGNYEYTYENYDRTAGMDFVMKYLRMKHVIVFKMSHDTIQFNFYDHSKLILSSQGHHIMHIDKNYNLTRHTLSQVMQTALQPSNVDPVEAKFQQKLFEKLKYSKDVLLSILSANASVTQE